MVPPMGVVAMVTRSSVGDCLDCAVSTGRRIVRSRAGARSGRHLTSSGSDRCAVPMVVVMVRVVVRVAGPRTASQRG